MEVYRLGLTVFATQLTGEGAKLHGGRWSLIGQSCIYTAESKALCALEYAVNVSREEIPDKLSFTTFCLPDGSWAIFEETNLPANWMMQPAPTNTKEWGTKHLQNNLAIKVPSVIIPSEFNFILNPLHPGFEKVRIKAVEPFTFDRRFKH